MLQGNKVVATVAGVGSSSCIVEFTCIVEQEGLGQCPYCPALPLPRRKLCRRWASMITLAA